MARIGIRCDGRDGCGRIVQDVIGGECGHCVREREQKVDTLAAAKPMSMREAPYAVEGVHRVREKYPTLAT